MFVLGSRAADYCAGLLPWLKWQIEQKNLICSNWTESLIAGPGVAQLTAELNGLPRPELMDGIATSMASRLGYASKSLRGSD